MYCNNNPVTYYDANGLTPRPLTNDERRNVQNAIDEIGEIDPERGHMLQKMLNDGDIMADDDLDSRFEAITTPGGKIIIGKEFINGHGDRDFVILVSILDHEAIHMEQLLSGRWNHLSAEQKEIEATTENIAFRREWERRKKQDGNIKVIKYIESEIRSERNYRRDEWKHWVLGPPPKPIRRPQYKTEPSVATG